MFLEGKDYLSIWEVSHRWANIDPDSTDPNSLPEEVRYYIHKIIEGYLGNEIKLRRSNGYRVSREPIMLFIWDLKPFLRYLWSCLSSDNFNKRKLTSYFVRRRDLVNLCKLEEIT